MPHTIGDPVHFPAAKEKGREGNMAKHTQRTNVRSLTSPQGIARNLGFWTMGKREKSIYLEMFANDSVKETDVGIPEPGQEDVLLNVRRLAPELGEGALLLEVKGLDLGGTEAVKAEGIPELGRSRSAW